MSYLKAFVAGGLAVLTALEAALDSGGVTAQEGVKAAVAGLVALGAVWAVPNRQP